MNIRILFPSIALLLAGCVTGGAIEPPVVTGEGTEPASAELTYEEAGLRVETVASGLDTPWDLVAGPDESIWFTERPGRLPLPDHRRRRTRAPGNPFGNQVWTYGHRNAQGLVYDPERDRFFITAHGPDDNDEVAIVRRSENHGWPAVHSFCDGDAPGEAEFCAGNEVAEPLAAWTPTIAPGGALYVATTNRDGRGRPTRPDDRIRRLVGE